MTDLKLEFCMLIQHGGRPIGTVGKGTVHVGSLRLYADAVTNDL